MLNDLKSGDIVCWHGGGYHNVPEYLFVQGVKLLAGAPTHISLVLNMDGWSFLWESMPQGQCLHLLDSRLATAKAEHWSWHRVLKLKDRSLLDEEILKSFCLERVGRRYDVVGAVRSIIYPRPIGYDNKLFCSASAMSALQAGGIITEHNPFWYTPKRVVESSLFEIGERIQI